VSGGGGAGRGAGMGIEVSGGGGVPMTRGKLKAMRADELGHWRDGVGSPMIAAGASSPATSKVKRLSEKFSSAT
jgi:hypothetical protein